MRFSFQDKGKYMICKFFKLNYFYSLFIRKSQDWRKEALDEMRKMIEKEDVNTDFDSDDKSHKFYILVVLIENFSTIDNFKFY